MRPEDQQTCLALMAFLDAYWRHTSASCTGTPPGPLRPEGRGADGIALIEQAREDGEALARAQASRNTTERRAGG